ncbi:MAG: ROK family protein [Ignavibacteria bacterium]|nr:ROK family protein [Ignavibacteria bacterium]
MITIVSKYGEGHYIGIDLGGTFIKAGLVDYKGNVIKKYKTVSCSQDSPGKVISQIEKCINNLIRKKSVRINAIGIGAPGIVSDGIVKYPPNFRNWKEVNLKGKLEKLFSIPVEVDNDANCAGLAEIYFGQGKKYRNFIFLTLGTGIGGAIIIDGKIYRGETNGAGEFGMMTINFNGPECLGGNPGAVEAYIGRNYFLKHNRDKLNQLGRRIDFDRLTVMASEGNKTAKSLFRKYGFYLGVGLVNYFNLMDMRVAVLGGGIANAFPFFISECKKTIKNRALKTIANSFHVLKSSVGDNAGLLGAAGLCFQ